MLPAPPTDAWSVFSQSPTALALIDAELHVVRVNQAWCELAGRPESVMVGRPAYDLVHDAEREEVRERLAELVAEGSPRRSGVQRLRRADGREIWLHVEAGLVDGADGERLLMLHARDVTEEHRVAARLRRLADRDHLTGLLNRRRVEEELERLLAGVRRHSRAASLVLIDLDHFKAVNDANGHEAGDQVLCFVAATLSARIRGGDAVGRLGGDEFAVLLGEVGAAEAERVAVELVSLVGDAPFTRERGVTLSAGVAELHGEVRTAQDALHAADLAMYAAKAAGRNRVAVHDPGRDGAAAVTPAATAGRPAATASTPPADGHADGEVERGLLDELRVVADAPGTSQALESVRDMLGADISYLTRHVDGEQVVLAVDGDGDSFGIEPAVRRPLAETYCQQILDGKLPAAMPDVRAVPAAAAMPVTAAAGVGAYASVPISLSDGSLYGTLCIANHTRLSRLGDRDLQFLRVLARLVAGEVERDAAQAAHELLRAQAAGTGALLTAIEARDRYTGAHSRGVVELATAVAEQLGLGQALRDEVAQVALVHDIGKLSVPDAILLKPGPLTPEETGIMRRHAEDGARIVAAIPELSHLAPAFRGEHERWDGGGYPDGLAGEEIPLAGRIVFVCDAWDAMTSDRPYRLRLTRDAAVRQVVDGAGTQFCPRCVHALLDVLGER